MIQKNIIKYKKPKDGLNTKTTGTKFKFKNRTKLIAFFQEHIFMHDKAYLRTTRQFFLQFARSSSTEELSSIANCSFGTGFEMGRNPISAEK